MSSQDMSGGSGGGELSPDQMALLEQVCCGDVAADDAIVLAARRDSAEFDRELQALVGTMQLVDDAGAAERDALGPDYGRPLADMEASGGPALRLRPRGLLALAALLVAALGVALWQFGIFDGREPRGLQFLSGAIRIELQQDGALAFGYSLEDSGSFSVEVLDEATGDVLEELEGLRAPLWLPPAAERDRWPEVVLVTVRAHTRFGDETASGRVRLRK